MLPVSIERQLAEDRVLVRGELDMETGPRLAEELLAVETGAPATLVLDLSEVSFFDSTGLQLVLDAEVRAASRSARSSSCPAKAGRCACSSSPRSPTA